MSDLNWLNQAGILRDGSDPLKTWLKNAIGAAGLVQELEVFQRALAELDAVPPAPGRDPDQEERRPYGTAADVVSQAYEIRLTDEIADLRSKAAQLTLPDLRSVIDVLTDTLHSPGQIHSIVAMSGLTDVRYPVGWANARQLWIAVFQAVLQAPGETCAALLDNIGDNLGFRSKGALAMALRESGRRADRRAGHGC